MYFSKEEVLAFLPHRDPFLFVDSIEKIEIPDGLPEKKIYAMKELNGGKVEGNFYVREDLEVLRGHFPGRPILPGVVQVEMMAQSSSFLITKSIEDLQSIDLEVALLGVDNSRFRKPIYPGVHLKLYGEQVRSRGSILNYDCRIECDGVLMSEASIMATATLKTK